MKVFYKLERAMETGEIVVVGRIYEGDVLPARHEAQANSALAAHGETAYCPEKHEHSKKCAVKLLDYKPVLVEAAPATKDTPAVEEVLGPSMREKIEKWFEEWDADPTPAVPKHVKMPQKDVEVVENGKRVTKQVDDTDL